MQRVVRSTLVGLLACAGLTACGDKITVPPAQTTPVSNVVRSVTVSPSNLSLNVGDKATLAASVNADAGVTDRTVTWSSSNTAVATVDANGVVTAVAAGNATITAASKADANVKGAAAVTVNGGGGTGAPAVISISTVNQTKCDINGGCTSVPANLGNVAGQLDVTVNVDPGSARLLGVDLIMNCSGNGNSGADTVIATQTLANASVSAEAAAAPVTLSFNTANFNSTTGAPTFFNGPCTLKARARTNTSVGGAVTNTISTGSQITLNNNDVVIGSLASTQSAINPNTGLSWVGGTITVTATPVFYSGRVPATMAITFAGKTQTVTGAGTKTAQFVDGNGANPGGANDIDGLTLPAAAATFSLIDTNGQSFGTNPCGGNLCSSNSVLGGAPAATPTVRLDTQKPAPGTIALASNTLQGTGANGYLGANFRFAADSAAGYTGPNAGSTVASGACAGNNGTTNPVTCNQDNNGVDNVTVTFQVRTTGAASSTYATRTGVSGLAETAATSGNGVSDQLRMITQDALGNADTTTVGTFGVDVTAPAVTQTSGPANQATSNTIGGTGSYVMSITDNLSGPNAQQLVAQVINNATVNSATLPANNTIYTNTGAAGTSPVATSINSGCIIGRFNRTSGAANASANALPVFDQTGAQIGTCSPTPYNLAGGTTVPANASGVSGYVTTRIIAVDQAGNQSASTTTVVAEDNSPPTVNNIDLPATVTGNSSQAFSASVSDNLDIVGTSGTINYATPTNGAGAISLQYPTTSGPGVAFDNVLTRSATATPVIPNFIKNLQVSTGGAVNAPAAGGNATSVTVTALDEVNNVGSLTATLAPAVSFTNGTSPTSTFGGAPFTNGLAVSAAQTTLSDCPAAGCGAAGSTAPANPTSTTLTVTASGTTGTFSNPFVGGAVQVWYQVGGTGPWFLAGNAGAGAASDNGVLRTWTYTFSFTPAKVTPNGQVITPTNGFTNTVNVMAIGVNANGDAVATQPVTITLTNP